MATATGIVTTAGKCRWGPDASLYDLDPNSAVAVNEAVHVLWEEGSFYYIEYNVGTSGRKRMYFPKQDIRITSGSVAPYPATNDARFIHTSAETRYAPYAGNGNPSAPSAGSLGLAERVQYTGKKEGDYALVTYDVSGTSGKKKRAWFPHMNLKMPPSPSPSTVYASVCTGVSTLTPAQKQANAAYICRYLMDLGFTKNAACGVLGNLERESGINPGIWEQSNNIYQGYGLVQWTPATIFLNRAVSEGALSSATAAAVNALTNSNPKKLLDKELECFLWCCTIRGDWLKPSGSMQHSGYSMTFGEFMKSTYSAGTLAIVFHDHYERSGDSLATIQSTRAAYATSWYNTL